MDIFCYVCDGEKYLAPNETIARLMIAASYRDASVAILADIKPDGMGAYYTYEGDEKEWATDLSDGKLPEWPEEGAFLLRMNSKVSEYIDVIDDEEMLPLSARDDIKEDLIAEIYNGEITDRTRRLMNLDE